MYGDCYKYPNVCDLDTQYKDNVEFNPEGEKGIKEWANHQIKPQTILPVCY